MSFDEMWEKSEAGGSRNWPKKIIARRFWDASRLAAIDEAARTCDRAASHQGFDGVVPGAVVCANRVRSLKTATRGGK